MKNFSRSLLYCLFACLFLIEKANGQINVVVNSHNTTCGLSNGSAQVIASGGVAAYSYVWSPGIPPVPSGDSAYSIAAGTHYVTVTDGVTQTIDTFTIAASTAPTVSIAANDSFCFRSGDLLTATASAAGGGYTWSGTAIPGGSSTLNPVNAAPPAAGSTYTVTVSWTDGTCTVTNTKTISTYNFAISNVSVTQPNCGRSNGSIIGYTTGNSQGSFYKNGILIQAQGGLQISNQGPGNYTFVANDLIHGCRDTAFNIILVDSTVHPIISNVAVTPEKCFGDRKGAIHITVDSCHNGCVFSWSQDPTNHTDSATSLKAGRDTFFVSEGGCTNIDTIIIVPGPTAKLSDSLRIHNDHCGHGIGSVQVVTNGGTSPFSYVWNISSATGDSISHVSGDTNILVAIVDAHGCIDTARGHISSSGSPHATLSRADTICISENTGVLTVTPSGSGPFTYHWSGGQTTATAAGLAAGYVSVTVADAYGCDTILMGHVPNFVPSNSISAIPNNVRLGESAELVVSPNVDVRSIVWNPYIPGSTGSTSIYVTPTETTEYTAIITYGQACQIFDTITITLVRDTSRMDTIKIDIPNTFTPNDDGVNDYFALLNARDVSSFHIWIYDRWGDKVYESTELDFRWYGTNNFTGNTPLSTGVFSYVTEIVVTSTGEKRVRGGNISLVK